MGKKESIFSMIGSYNIVCNQYDPDCTCRGKFGRCSHPGGAKLGSIRICTNPQMLPEYNNFLRKADILS
jgi:hypothetical protein